MQVVTSSGFDKPLGVKPLGGSSSVFVTDGILAILQRGFYENEKNYLC